jgi:3-hydroxybutyryl-CoA dehydrogenase
LKSPSPGKLEVNCVGVIGAGAIGAGIAHACCHAGIRVRLKDVSENAGEAALASISRDLARQVAKGQLSEAEREAAFARVELTSSYAELTDCDLIIEAATEDENIKRQIFTALGPVLKPEAIIGSTTSLIAITHLAANTDRPARFIGIHFMHPVAAMELVELIRGIATEDQTFEAAQAFVGKLGKTAIESADFPAFIVNRILVPLINEAVYTLYEGVASVDAIDTALRLGAHHRMGPLQLADFIGLDTCLALMQSLHDGLSDTKYRPCPLLVKYVEAGWLGRKTKRGFYDYRGEAPIPTR